MLFTKTLPFALLEPLKTDEILMNTLCKPST